MKTEIYLTEKEFNSLDENDKTEYLKLDENEKQTFTETYRLYSADNSANENVSETKTISSNEKSGATESGKAVTTSNEETQIASNSNAISEREEKRGRHKKDCSCDKCVAKRNSPNNLGRETVLQTNSSGNDKLQVQQPKKETAEEQLRKELSEYKIETNNNSQSPTTTQTQENFVPQVDITQFINGALFLVALDYCFPLILKYGVGTFNPVYKRINENGFEKLKLTKEERKLLEPSANALVLYIFKDANPIVIFFVVSMAVYGGKFALLGENDFHPVKEKKQIENNNSQKQIKKK